MCLHEEADNDDGDEKLHFIKRADVTEIDKNNNVRAHIFGTLYGIVCRSRGGFPAFLFG